MCDCESATVPTPKQPTDAELAEYRHACILGEPERLTADQVPTDGTLGDLQRTKPSKAGFIALLGGLWEWTQDGQLYGGSYNSKRDEIDTWNATEVSHPHHANDVGFRIARSLK